MKRDLELIREILLKMEEHEGGYFMTSGGDFEKHFPDLPFKEVGYHCYLLKDAGLIEATSVINHDDENGLWCLPLHLNSAGHDFLAVLKNDTFWNGLKTTVSTSGAWTFKTVLQAGVVAGVKLISG